MKDLFLFTADADAFGFMRGILRRPQALAIRDITYDIERHAQRDSGMIQSGAELTRMKKGKYGKALLMWDHHGSGRDHKQAPHVVAAEMQKKLESYTWSGNCAVTVLVPELEQWLWYCEKALASHLKVSVNQLQEWVDTRSRQLGVTPDQLRQQQPKELFEYVMRDVLRRTISPWDFEEIGTKASIAALGHCESFHLILTTLREWFPKERLTEELPLG